METPNLRALVMQVVHGDGGKRRGPELLAQVRRFDALIQPGDRAAAAEQMEAFFFGRVADEELSRADRAWWIRKTAAQDKDGGDKGSNLVAQAKTPGIEPVSAFGRAAAEALADGGEDILSSLSGQSSTDAQSECAAEGQIARPANGQAIPTVGPPAGSDPLSGHGRSDTQPQPAAEGKDSPQASRRASPNVLPPAGSNVINQRRPVPPARYAGTAEIMAMFPDLWKPVMTASGMKPRGDRTMEDMRYCIGALASEQEGFARQAKEKEQEEVMARRAKQGLSRKSAELDAERRRDQRILNAMMATRRPDVLEKDLPPEELGKHYQRAVPA